MTELDKRLEKAVAERSRLSKEVERLQVRREEAEKNLQAVEEECRSKKVDPDRIDEVIEQLETKYREHVEEIESKNQDLQTQLKPYLGDSE